MSERSWGTNLFWGAVGLTAVFTLIVPSCIESFKDTALNDGKPDETNVQQFNRTGVEKLINNSSSAVEGITDKIGETIENTTEEDMVKARESFDKKGKKIWDLGKAFIFKESTNGNDSAQEPKEIDCDDYSWTERQYILECMGK